MAARCQQRRSHNRRQRQQKGLPRSLHRRHVQPAPLLPHLRPFRHGADQESQAATHQQVRDIHRRGDAVPHHAHPGLRRRPHAAKDRLHRGHGRHVARRHGQPRRVLLQLVVLALQRRVGAERGHDVRVIHIIHPAAAAQPLLLHVVGVRGHRQRQRAGRRRRHQRPQIARFRWHLHFLGRRHVGNRSGIILRIQVRQRRIPSTCQHLRQHLRNFAHPVQRLSGFRRRQRHGDQLLEFAVVLLRRRRIPVFGRDGRRQHHFAWSQIVVSRNGRHFHRMLLPKYGHRNERRRDDVR
mmetsp:Transcript_28321/g.79605  ORF Transcript_28321/g.79605 Transcript_28321/m.79605 type:complete len:295 (-) Transcript_28321:3173-4057(-)